jgi:hypothetical protein
LDLTATPANAQFYITIWKNGSIEAFGTTVMVTPTWGINGPSNVSKLVYLDGATDYINCKLYSAFTTGSWRTTVTTSSYFQAIWIRP